MLSAAEFAAVMNDHGWAAPVELIAGEVVFVTPTGGSASFAQVEIAHALRFLGPDVAWWGSGASR